MKKIYNHPRAFTLIEIIVAVTIFGIIMISVMSIFFIAAETSKSIEIARVLQQNTKSLVEDISQSIRSEWIYDLSPDILTDCSETSFSLWTEDYKTGTKLCIGDGDTAYFIAQQVAGSWQRVANVEDCRFTSETAASLWRNPCRMVKKQQWTIFPITNNRVHIANASFFLANRDIPRITIMLDMHSSVWEGVRSDNIEKSRLIFQTSLSERLIFQDL